MKSRCPNQVEVESRHKADLTFVPMLVPVEPFALEVVPFRPLMLPLRE
jgi:hypothetical protein